MDLKTFDSLDDAGKAAALSLDKKVADDEAAIKTLNDAIAKLKAENAEVSGKLAKTEKERAEAINLLYNGSTSQPKKKTFAEVLASIK